MAVVNYHDTYGEYPPAYIAGSDGKPMHSWRVLILPFLEQQELYDRYDFSQPWNSETNLKIAGEMPEIFRFHGSGDTGSVTTNYLAVVGENTVWPGATGRKSREITDDVATTILIVENEGAGVHWLEPRDLQAADMSRTIGDPNGISSVYAPPAVVTLGGSLRKLNKGLPPEVLSAMLTVNGDEKIEETGDTWQLLQDGRDRPKRKHD